MNNDLQSYWHPGELAIQARAGTDQKMAEIGPQFIREYMPQQHRDFFESLTQLFIGYRDHNSYCQSSVIFGTAGFIQSVNNTELIINTQAHMGDCLHDTLCIGDDVGLLGIEFHNKRRNRLNAMIIDISQKYIRIKVKQSFGNCPKYIQPKILMPNQQYGQFSMSYATQLDEDDQRLIRQSDTFFIASHYADGQEYNSRGIDISHRGGEPGFVKISESGLLCIEDYQGNGFFNTLGNLLTQPIASLLFCDWYQGCVLQLLVTSEIHWHEKVSTASSAHKTARTVTFKPLQIKRINHALAYVQRA